MPHPDAVPLALRETAYAKINLALHVRHRRADGYHELESLFAFAEDGDVLEAQALPDGEIRLGIDGPFAADLASDADNLVSRAARLLRERFGRGDEGAAIRLTKNLPVASGIGGGSADAAATLRLLARLWGIGIDEAGLVALGADIGSDVPACVVSHTLVGTGRGEALNVRELEGLAGAPLLLVNPGIPLSTADVFGAWDHVDRGPLTFDGVATLPQTRNDLEPPARSLVPVIGDAVAWLADRPGVMLARMSGSGATCFALFGDVPTRDAAAARLNRDHHDWWIMASRFRR